MSVKIHLIAAARPNFMKVAPLYHALKAAEWAEPMIVHTGQHYDRNMSDAILEDLRVPAPDFHLGVGSGSHADSEVVMGLRKSQVAKERVRHVEVVMLARVYDSGVTPVGCRQRVIKRRDLHEVWSGCCNQMYYFPVLGRHQK